MATLARTPTVPELTGAYRVWLDAILRDAAGRDGRMTEAAAHRLAEREDVSRLASDNALKTLRRAGQKSMSVDRMVDAEVARLEREASRVAGANGRVSLTEIRGLPVEFVDDVLHLRGKGRAFPPPRDPTELRETVKRAVIAALDGGTAVKLSGPPFGVRGRRPVVDSFVHAGSNTRVEAWIVRSTIYISRGQSGPPPAPLAGWYRIGRVPE